jgi:hypothetical protein
MMPYAGWILVFPAAANIFALFAGIKGRRRNLLLTIPGDII